MTLESLYVLQWYLELVEAMQVRGADKGSLRAVSWLRQYLVGLTRLELSLRLL